MATTIRMLGSPVIVHDDVVNRVRGKKTWALLARILLSDRPLPRRQLAAEIFPDADDPMGALRWSLSQARGALGSPTSLVGDPVEPRLASGVVVDVRQPDLGMDDVLEVSGSLLDGVDGQWTPDYDMWLSVERARAESRLIGALHHEAEIAMARNDLVRATVAAREMVRRAPMDESSYVMLVHALTRAGDTSAAADVVRACEELFLAELGVAPTPALSDAARPTDRTGRTHVSPAASVRALLESGSAALDAGAIDAGVSCMRQAVAAIEDDGDTQLAATAWCALGSALVHAVRGADDEGQVALRRAADLALHVGDRNTAVSALTELGYAETLAGRRSQADANFCQATDLVSDAGLAAQDDPRCAILGFSGLNLADGGNTPLALERFRDAVERADAGAQRRPLIFALTVGARSLIDSGDPREAATWLARADALIAEEKWLSFRPLARCLQHQLDLAAGHPTSDLRNEIEETYSHSCQLGDPCWEAAAARMLGLTWATDQPDTAFSWFAEARSKAAAYTDMWAWVTGAVLDSEVTVALAIDDGDRAQAAARQLLDQATQRQLDGFVDRAVAVLRAV